MKFALRRFLVFNRIPVALVLVLLGILLGVKVSWWLGWIPILVGLLTVVAHFFIGPMTLIQTYVEAGDIEGARGLLNRVKKPQWLYKPVRSSYYMLRGNLSTMTDDLDTAEADIRASLAAGLPEKEYEGAALLQLGAISMKKGNMKDAYEHIQAALKKGLPDEDSKASAFLQLSNILLQRRSYKGAKMYFARAKSCKTKNADIIGQIKEMSSYMSRLPG